MSSFASVRTSSKPSRSRNPGRLARGAATAPPEEVARLAADRQDCGDVGAMAAQEVEGSRRTTLELNAPHRPLSAVTTT